MIPKEDQVTCPKCGKIISRQNDLQKDGKAYCYNCYFGLCHKCGFSDATNGLLCEKCSKKPRIKRMKDKIIKHWLYGDCKFNVLVRKETECKDCVHCKPCVKIQHPNSYETLCLNFHFGRSDGQCTCVKCLHRFTRWAKEEKDKIPCFRCRFFRRKHENRKT